MTTTLAPWRGPAAFAPFLMMGFMLHCEGSSGDRIPALEDAGGADASWAAETSAEPGDAQPPALDAAGSHADGPTDGARVPSADARIAAATSTAQDNDSCQSIRPFYWEIGDKDARLASGSISSPTDATTYDASSRLSIASASKWLYATYWVQRTGGILSATDVKFLHFESGYSQFSACAPGDTVGSCLDAGANGTLFPETENKFLYSGGHMQNHAAQNGLADLDDQALAVEICSQLGCDTRGSLQTVPFGYSQPQLAGGVATTSVEYAKILRKMLSGELKMNALLGTSPVCTNPAYCPDAIASPSPRDEQWHYSIGHWVEDDPNVGDGAFSSAGAFGYYPWVDATKTYYGILARQDYIPQQHAGFASAKCGRLIRKAFVTGIAQ